MPTAEPYNLNSVRHSPRRVTASSNSRQRSDASELRWLWLGLFLLALALLGGSSRPDPVQNALLRPLMALLLIPALYQLRFVDFKRMGMLAALLGLTLLWMVVQLAPLPPVLWQSLPDRAVIAQIDQLTGNEGVWRPLSFTPFRGLNAVLGMLVPITALLLASSLKLSSRAILLSVICIGLLDAAFGLLQVVGGPRSPLYLFAISSRGAPAGIFANENHSAVFSALSLLAIARAIFEPPGPREPGWLKFLLAPAFLFVLFAVMVTGSRAGFAATLVALTAAGLMAFIKSPAKASDRVMSAKANRRADRGNLLPVLFAGVIGVVMIAFLWLQRTPALEDLFQRSSFEDLRWSLWPILRTMAEQHWLFGTGFGSFEAVYHAYEPTELLLPLYVNHAHNDWAQLIIEGGAPAILLLATGLAWLAKSLWQITKTSSEPLGLLIFWLASIAIISAASIVDYPLRTPIFQGVVVWLLISLILDKDRDRASMPIA